MLCPKNDGEEDGAVPQFPEEHLLVALFQKRMNLVENFETRRLSDSLRDLSLKLETNKYLTKAFKKDLHDLQMLLCIRIGAGIKENLFVQNPGIDLESNSHQLHLSDFKTHVVRFFQASSSEVDITEDKLDIENEDKVLMREVAEKIYNMQGYLAIRNPQSVVKEKIFRDTSGVWEESSAVKYRSRMKELELRSYVSPINTYHVCAFIYYFPVVGSFAVMKQLSTLILSSLILPISYFRVILRAIFRWIR
jgi:hypothetical protein